MMGSDSSTVRTIVGLEVHVQLHTRTKLFCGCPLRSDAPPNSCVCPVCLGHPGALPVINRRAVELAVLTGMALKCAIARHTKWDRKSYYYPDMPKNYQISQYDMPLALGGYFEIDVKGKSKRVRIRRAHLEEDAGKNIHDVAGCSLVDLNRAGTPLLEIVTEPDIGSAEEAFTFCTELHKLVTYLGVSEGSMQKGHMRFEPNVNIAITTGNGEIRTPIAEIKNLNSFKSVRTAIEYESQRQLAAWETDNEYELGKRPNENRGFVDDKQVTEFQRGKEEVHDYRYFPDPDLVPVECSEAVLDEIRASLPELPLARRKRFATQFDLSAEDAETIMADRAAADLFESAVGCGAPAGVVGKQLINVWIKLSHDRGSRLTELGVDAERIADLAGMTAEGSVSATAASRLAEAMVDDGASPMALAERFGLVQVRDQAATVQWVEEAFSANQKAVEDATKNPKKAKAAAGFLRGQVMRISGGKADPKLVGRLIDGRLAGLRDNAA